MATPALIFCAGGNKRYAEIAIEAGYKYGAQLPNTVYFPPYFADQDWKKPNRAAYMQELAKHKPFMASVLDWEKEDQLPEVLSWAEEAAQYVRVVMLIPKVQGGIKRLPWMIGGAEVRLGYSVPTKYGGTELFLSEFEGRPVHLLGGSPQKQMDLTNYLNVVSVDGNMQCKMAQACRFWRKRKGVKGHWLTLSEVGDGNWGKDSNYEAFKRSCENIIAAWHM